jgi:NAD(P)-dependent dehydrogenase (short-subunit alcohol dehydrogenase family)
MATHIGRTETSVGQDQFSQQDPIEQHAAPGSGHRTVEHPGRTGELDVKPDHGEETYRGSGRLEGKKSVITGGDSGIGRAVALAFAREGADVLISYLEDEEKDARETVRLVEEAGRRAVTVPGDLQDEAQCGSVVDRAVQEFGQIDVLVSNAAFQMSQDGGIYAITTEQFDRVMKTNVYAMFWLCKAAIPHMPEGSTIITTSSVQAFSPSPHLLDYATSKAAIVNFTKGLGSDLSEKGIRVNSVAPGPVWTPLIPATMPEEKVETFGEQSPLGRAAQPAELAPIYVFLASQESSYITSEVVGVTGGSPIT